MARLLDLDEALRAGAPEHGVLLELRHPFAERLDDRKVGIDHCVDEEIGEIVGAGLARAASPVTDRGADGAERIPLNVFLDRDDPPLTEEHADLLFGQSVVLAPQRAEHDEVVLVVALGLRPLRDVHRVFQREGMQPEPLSELRQHARLEPVDVDPRDAARIHVRERPFERALTLLEGIA